MFGDRINKLLLKYSFAFAFGISLLACGDSSIEQALEKDKNTIIITNTGTDFNAIKGLMMPLTARGGTGSYRWSVADEAKATITSEGQFTGLQVGKVEVTAVDSEGHGGKATLVISDAELQFISISPNNANDSVVSGDSTTYSVVGLYSNKTTIDITDQATWSTDTPDSISFPDSRGTVKSKYGFVGESVITVSFRDSTAITTLRVKKPQILVTGAGNVTSATVGSTLLMSASGIVSGNYRWSVNDKTIGYIDITGLLHISQQAIAADITVTATDVDNADFFGTATITVPRAVNVNLIAELVGGNPKKVAIQGKYAYIAADSIFSIVDISDPANPSQKAYLDMPGIAYDVAISGDYAYVADGSSLRIINISDPTAPVETSVDTENAFYGSVTVRGNYAYVTDYGLRIIDIRDPTAPIEVGRVTMPEQSGSTTIKGNYAYVVGKNVLRIIDIVKATAPKEIGAIDTISLAFDVAVKEFYAYVADNNGVHVIDIRDPTSPVDTGTIDTGAALDLAIKDNRLYVANSSQGLRIFDISKASTPTEIQVIDTPGTASGVAISDSYAYVADGDRGLRIIDINPTSLGEIGALDMPQSDNVVLSGNHAFAFNIDRVRIIDIRVPSSLVEVGAISARGAFDIAIGAKNDYAYAVSGSLSGLRIFNINNPANPTEVGNFNPYMYNPSGVAIGVNSEYVYIADYPNLSVVDIRNPSAPSRIASTAVAILNQTKHGRVAINENLAYLIGYGGLGIFDISAPNTPRAVGSYDTVGARVLGVAFKGNLAYVLTKRTEFDNYIPREGSSSLLIINISVPSAPTLVGSYDALPGIARDVLIDGKYAYVASGYGGLRVIDVSVPAVPVEKGMYNTPGIASGVARKGNYIIVADASAGFEIYEFIAP
ncbi:MAG: Ig-like domain-containing protein [Thiohalomonadales bacterium]